MQNVLLFCHNGDVFDHVKNAKRLRVFQRNRSEDHVDGLTRVGGKIYGNALDCCGVGEIQRALIYSVGNGICSQRNSDSAGNTVEVCVACGNQLTVIGCGIVPGLATVHTPNIFGNSAVYNAPACDDQLSVCEGFTVMIDRVKPFLELPPR